MLDMGDASLVLGPPLTGTRWQPVRVAQFQFVRSLFVVVGATPPRADRWTLCFRPAGGDAVLGLDARASARRPPRRTRYFSTNFFFVLSGLPWRTRTRPFGSLVRKSGVQWTWTEGGKVRPSPGPKVSEVGATSETSVGLNTRLNPARNERPNRGWMKVREFVLGT